MTPMLKQYFEIKKNHSDSILFFRLGDFYEMFGDDAKEASKILDITLTARNKGRENEIAMCGIPYHALGIYLPKLTKAGKKVAICEQVSDPNLPGIVERKVARIVTPGTTLDNNILDGRENNYLISIYKEKEIFGLAIVDVSTGEFKLSEINNFEQLKNILTRLTPAEVIIGESLFSDDVLMSFLKNITNINKFSIPFHENAYQNLLNHFRVKNLEGFGVENFKIAIKAAGKLLGYLKETQKTDLEHINKLFLYNISGFMLLDEATIRNLELLQTSYEGKYEGSLLWVIDQTLTSMGGRLLRQWLLHPLIEKNKIIKRVEVVGEFKEDFSVSENLKKILKFTIDLERLLGRIGCARANARDLVNLKNSLRTVPEIKKVLENTKSDYLKVLMRNFDKCEEVIDLIERYIEEDPPVLISEGGIIKKGVDKDLDELKEISTSGKDFIKNLQAREIKRTGINSLKVKFNKVFGYYIEISKTNLDNAPDDYIRKQTLVNAERFITPELKEYEEKVLSADDKIKEIEQRIFFETVEKTKPHFLRIQKNAQIIACLDVLLSFSILAGLNNYSRPDILEDGSIFIKQGRHPVIEKISNEDYIPNDLLLNNKDNEFILLTGPNMSGKSSFLRQNALIVLLAQIGSFVPAESCEVSLVDRIFTRVGASDNLNRGQSTFMVEMQEAANILNNATKNSLVILDELGRGTSTYDGVSIAWAIMEYIHANIGAKTLFATHYHELVDVVNNLERADNYCVAVKENDGEVIFLRKVVKGAIDKSYGIEVAKLAGLPKKLTDQASDYLVDLERGKGKRIKLDQQPLFESGEALQCVSTNDEKEKNEKYKEIVEKLKMLDLDNMTPVEAVVMLEEIKRNF